MKRNLLLAVALSTALAASAQGYFPDAVNVDMTRHNVARSVTRKEFILPAVNGYNAYKADLHVHSIYSDAECTPEYRVREAWMDGLDVIAMTDHIEYRRHEPKLLEFLAGYVPEGTKAINNSIAHKGAAATAEGIQADLNVSVGLAVSSGPIWDITVIPGAEITRDPVTIGHYNALFTTDNNAIYEADPLQILRNAKAQGALIMHNHPGWRRTSLDYPEFEVKAYGEHLIDGIETMNGPEFYPKAISRAKEHGLFVASNTDIHATTAEAYGLIGQQRDMTLIFAKDKSLASLREALEARRTLAYSLGTLVGDEQLLRDFFMASVSCETVNTDKKGTHTVMLTNRTSMPFVLHQAGENPVVLEPLSTVRVQSKKDQLTYTVENLWYSEKDHLTVDLKLK